MSWNDRPPDHKVGPVKKSSLAERFLYCAAMLHLSGFMSDGERKQVHKQMMKWKKKHERTAAS